MNSEVIAVNTLAVIFYVQFLSNNKRGNLFIEAIVWIYIIFPDNYLVLCIFKKKIVELLNTDFFTRSL